jgi:hypothetical protein
MNPKRKKRKQINRRKTRRNTPLRIVGWLAITAFVGLAVFLTVDLVRSRGGGVQQSAAAPVTTRAAATAEPYAGGGRLYLPVTEVDLGNVPFMTPASYSFDLVNVGDAPLVISDAGVKMLEGC